MDKEGQGWFDDPDYHPALWAPLLKVGGEPGLGGVMRNYFQVKNLDAIITIIGLIYGVLLISASFISTKVTEAFRIDALFMAQPSEATRKINLVAGVAIIGYNIYAMF